MIILKHVEYKINDSSELEELLIHLTQTTSEIDGVELLDIYFPKERDGFVLLLKCASEDKYLEWREICPPPPGAKDWYEVFLTKNEHFSNPNKADIYPIKPELTEKVRIIFEEASDVESMDAKFGRTLSVEENEVRSFILSQAPILGHLPSIDEIRRAFAQYPNEKIDAVLKKLNQVDAIHLVNDKTAITTAYPFSGLKTLHIVTLKKEGYQKMYAMCSIDALGICFMFDCDVSIESRCGHCNDMVDIEIKDKEIISLVPENVLVWFDRDYSVCAATSCCPNTNFFTSKQHFEEWHKGRLERKGNLLQIQEAFGLGKLYFEKRLK